VTSIEENEEKAKTIQPPLLVFFSPSTSTLMDKGFQMLYSTSDAHTSFDQTHRIALKILVRHNSFTPYLTKKQNKQLNNFNSCNTRFNGEPKGG